MLALRQVPSIPVVPETVRFSKPTFNRQYIRPRQTHLNCCYPAAVADPDYCWLLISPRYMCILGAPAGGGCWLDEGMRPESVTGSLCLPLPPGVARGRVGYLFYRKHCLPFFLGQPERYELALTNGGAREGPLHALTSVPLIPHAADPQPPLPYSMHSSYAINANLQLQHV